MNILEYDCLWQLYTFSVSHILFGLSFSGIFFDPCIFITDSACKEGAEVVTTRMASVGLLYVGAYFFILTYINYNKAPKLKRLSNMGLSCSVALLASIVFFGPRSQGGFERSSLYFFDLLIGMALIAIMGSAIGSSEMAERKSPFTDLGLNPKTFILLLAIIIIFKFIALSEFVSPSTFLADSDSVTSLSHFFWQWMVLILLTIFFPINFALMYGDEKDQEAITWTTVLMMVLSILFVMPLWNDFKDGYVTMGFVSFAVFFILALVAIFTGKRRGGYETVPNDA